MEIFNIKLNKLKYKDFLNNLKNHVLVSPPSPPLEGGTRIEQKIIFTPNPEILLNTLKDEEFKEILQKADYLTIDGIGIYIGLQMHPPLTPFSGGTNKVLNFILLPYYFFNLFFRRKFLEEKYGERVCGSDLTKDLVDFASDKDIKITILDPYFPQDLKKCETQESFRDDLQKVFPKLKFDFFIYKPEQKEDIIKQICASDSKILFSTLGMKSQEKSVIEVMEKCKNIKLGLGVGSSFDYFIGFQKRAPKIIRKLGLEWFYRLITGPQKIKRMKRLYNAIFVFIWKVLTK